MLKQITPCMLFDGQAEKAAKFYVSVFKRSKILSVSPLYVKFRLDGVDFVALNGPSSEFTWAVSFYVPCKTQKEIDDYWKKLSSGGEEQPCGWVKDKFGVSWQVVPAGVEDLLADPDKTKVDRMLAALMKMKKLDFAALKKAHAGK